MNKSLFCAGLLTLSSSALAEEGFSVSVNSTLAGISYEDTDGKTDTSSMAIPLTFAVDYVLDRSNKISASWRLIDNRIKAKVGKVGATLNGHQLSLSWLRKMRLTRYVQPSLGFGVRSSFIEATNKFSIDDEGFLLNMLNDTEDTYLSAMLSVTNDWKISDQGWRFNTGFDYDLPLDNGIQGFTLLVGIKKAF